MSVSSDGQSIVFTPNSAWSGTANLYYYAAVANEPWLTAIADVTVTVTKVDQAPVAYDASFSTSENTPLSSNIRGYMYDPDGDTLTTSALTQPAHGTLAFTSDGSFTYTPDNNYYGADSFTYQTADPSGTTAQATVTLNVRFVDQPPVAQQDNVTTDEGTPVTFNVLANDSDPDGDPLHVTGIVTAPDRGTAVVNSDGTITYTPTGNLAGTDVFVYQIADPTGDTSNAFVVVAVNPVNDAPTASFTWTSGSHHSANFSATASDVDGSALSYAWDFGDGTTGTGSSAQHRYKRSGTYVVTLTVTDDQGAQTTIQKSVTI